MYDQSNVEGDSSSLKFDNIHCIHHNLHRSGVATSNFNKFLSKFINFIGLIQEPDVYKNSVRGFSNSFYRIYAGSITSRPRAAIVVNKAVASHILPLAAFNDRDLSAIIYSDPSNLNTKLVFASYYLHEDLPIPHPKMRKLVKHCKDNKLPLILGGDANAHHSLWNSTDINDRGDELYSFLMSNNLHSCNIGHSPTFITRSRQEMLDVTITNSSAHPLVRDWKVSVISTTSDHRIVEFNVTAI